MAATGLRIHVFQHVPFEGPGYIEDWARESGHTVTTTRFYEKHRLPSLNRVDWLIIMGGPMSANDTETHPWLQKETEFIRRAVEADKTVLGICLGAQLIAGAMGASIYANREQEIGWYPVQFKPPRGGRSGSGIRSLFRNFPKEITVLHWHGDTFDLPEGASLFASSHGCENQLFAVGERVVGIQFHFESTPESLEALVDNGSDESARGPHVMPPGEIVRNRQHIPTNNRYMKKILTHLEEHTVAAA
jgi:GMP synthase-like glutamine amidotransferase